MKTTYSTAALRARILDKYNSIDDFAVAVNMKPAILKSRLNNRTEFNLDEMRKICTALDIRTDRDIKRLFFADEAAEMMSMTKAIVKMADGMTDEQFKLLIEIMDLVTGRPDRREFALNWPGKMRDLPAALARI